MMALKELVTKKFDLEDKLFEKNNQTEDLNEKTIQLSLFRETLLK